jgi:hypothetical protein
MVGQDEQYSTTMIQGFHWKKGKQQQSYKRNQEWLEYSSNMPSPKISKLEELQSCAQYALIGLEMALQLHL